MRILDLANYVINKAIEFNKPVNWSTLNRILLLINNDLSEKYDTNIISEREKEGYLNPETNEVIDIYITSVKYEYSSQGASKIISTKEIEHYLDYNLLDKIDPVLEKYLNMSPGEITDKVREDVYSKYF